MTTSRLVRNAASLLAEGFLCMQQDFPMDYACAFNILMMTVSSLTGAEIRRVVPLSREVNLVLREKSFSSEPSDGSAQLYRGSTGGWNFAPPTNFAPKATTALPLPMLCQCFPLPPPPYVLHPSQIKRMGVQVERLSRSAWDTVRRTPQTTIFPLRTSLELKAKSRDNRKTV